MGRIFVFGGSFDPIHMGHLILAQNCSQALNARVVFLPTGNPPHKVIGTPTIHRLNMLKLAVAGNKNFEICTYEINKNETSYTYETLKYLQNVYNKEIFFFVGGDSLQDLHNWKEPKLILERCTLVYAKRLGYNFEATEHIEKYGLDLSKIKEINTPVIEISSTDIRKKVEKGYSVKYLVPDSVERYIKAHKLYI